jgi:hypothetical protein
MITTTRKVKFILRWAVGISAYLVTAHFSNNVGLPATVSVVAFFITRAVLGMWTTPIDEFYDALRSGKPERVKAAMALRAAAEKGDKEEMKMATDALAKAIREGK